MSSISCFDKLKRHYYKYGYEPNVDIYGNPTIENAIIKTFTTSNYTQVEGMCNSTDNIDYIIKFKTSDINTLNVIFSTYHFVSLEKNDGNITVYNSDGGTRTVLCPLIADTWYWVKSHINGQTKTVYYSTDGINYTLGATVTDVNVAASSTPVRFGVGVDSDYGTSSSWISEQLFDGEIDLKECFIKKGDTILWSGTKIEEIPFDKHCSLISPNIIRRYYKYVTFQQPLITSNCVMGGKSFACNQSNYLGVDDNNYAYGMFYDTTGVSPKHWQINNISNFVTQPPFVEWYNPYPIKTSSLEIKNLTGSYAVNEYVFYGSNDYSNWEELTSGTNTNTTGNAVWTITIPSVKQKLFKYFKLTCTATSDTSIMINRIKINATYLTNGLISDYDYYEDDVYDYYEDKIEYKMFKTDTKLYYKYHQFERPKLTENGTMGGDSFAVNQSAYYTESDGTKRMAWQAFDNYSDGTRWQVNSVNTGTFYNIEWYNPTLIIPAVIAIRNHNGAYSVKDYVLYSSDDNSNWTEILSGTNDNVTTYYTWNIYVPLEKQKPYKYLRLSCKPRVTTAIQIRDIEISGVYLTTGSENSYDYYDTKYSFKSFLNN